MSVITEKQKKILDVQIIIKTVKNVEYRQPIIFVDGDTGEVQYRFDQTVNSRQLGDINFLYRIFVEKDGVAVSAEGVDEANAFLIERSLNGGSKLGNSTGIHSKGLAYYFQFLHDTGNKWNEFPIRPYLRPTYRFREHLKSLANIGKDKIDRTENPLAVSTVKGYINAVVDFYKYQILCGVRFDNPPFQYEKVSILSDTHSASSMSGFQRYEVLTTNLRIKAKSQKGSIPNQLMALSEYEWEVFDEVFRIDGIREVIKNGIKTYAPVAIENKFMFLLMRWAGLRREEVASLREHQIFKPSVDQFKKGYVEFKLSPQSFNNIKGDKARVVEVPTPLMNKLNDYKLSIRFIQRREKYEINNSNNVQTQIPIFISQKGNEYELGSINARFSEIRAIVSDRLERPFHHKPHNLRSTYAVFRLRALAKAFIDANMPVGEAFDRALDHVKNHLGHEHLATTALYLKQAQDEVSAEETAEAVLEYADRIAESSFNIGE